jgi:hypothetical protein
MATIAQVMDAMAAQLENELATGAAAWPVKLHIEPRAFSVAETPAIDMLIASPTGLEAGLAGYGELYGGIPITIRVRVSTADLYTGEDLLLALIDDEGPLSIVEALDADHSLNGMAQDIKWNDGFPWSGYTDFTDVNGEGFFLGSLLQVVVLKAFS